MNSKKEVKKIKVNSGVELVSQAREYKNSGGEWKLRERYMEMRTGSMKKCPKWGIIISNGKQKIDICSTNNVFVESGIRDEVKVRDELEKLFPKYGEALFAGSDKEHDRYGGRPHQSKLDFNTYKRVKDTDGECDLVRYLVAESSWDLKKILHEYIQENETKIYQSANPHFSGWVEIVDGQDGNIYLYVGEKNEGGGREIKVGVKKEAFYKTEHNFYAKSGGGYYSAEEMLELAWNLFTITRPRTSAETHEYYSKNGGLEQEWQRNWPHRQGLCRKYLEELRERMNQKFNYLQDKAKQKNYQDNEVNEQIILAKFHAEEINYHLTDMKKKPTRLLRCLW